jgi:hypothetical protein
MTYGIKTAGVNAQRKNILLKARKCNIRYTKQTPNLPTHHSQVHIVPPLPWIIQGYVTNATIANIQALQVFRILFTQVRHRVSITLITIHKTKKEQQTKLMRPELPPSLFTCLSEWWPSWLRHRARRREVPVWFPVWVLGNFQVP